MLEHLPDCLKTAGPLIIFGAFVLAFERRIFPAKVELEELSHEVRWIEEKKSRASSFFEIVSAVVITLVILGVFFGLLYTWLGVPFLLHAALGCMSAVSLILLITVIRILPYSLLRNFYSSWRLARQMEKAHPNE